MPRIICTLCIYPDPLCKSFKSRRDGEFWPYQDDWSSLGVGALDMIHDHVDKRSPPPSWLIPTAKSGTHTTRFCQNFCGSLIAPI